MNKIYIVLFIFSLMLNLYCFCNGFNNNNVSSKVLEKTNISSPEDLTVEDISVERRPRTIKKVFLKKKEYLIINIGSECVEQRRTIRTPLSIRTICI